MDSGDEMIGPQPGVASEEVVVAGSMDNDHKEPQVNVEVQQALHYAEDMEDELRYVADDISSVARLTYICALSRCGCCTELLYRVSPIERPPHIISY